jgi:histidinol dehydrogenase
MGVWMRGGTTAAVGLYVPGGTAVLPSTTLMLAVPAKIAGCKTIVLASPPQAGTGDITPEVLYCAKKAGVTHLLKAGGAQVRLLSAPFASALEP